MNYARPCKISKVIAITGFMNLIICGCIHNNGAALQGTEQAKAYVSTQPSVIARTGMIKTITEIDATARGRNMPFGWGDRIEENHIFYIQGEHDSAIAKVSMRRTPKTEWKVTGWSILDANDAAQYTLPKTANTQ